MKTLLSKEDLHDGVMRMADKIAGCYENRQLTIVGVLTGSVVLMADLIRLIDLPMRVGVLQASSYRGATTTRGELVINSELMLDISGRDVLLVDDIFDTGHTLAQDGRKNARFRAHIHPLGRAACASTAGRKSNTCPTSWRSTSRTSSSSATASTTKTCTATCRTWPRWNRTTSPATSS